ncbi:tol-pal system protein YbgF [Marinobacter sp. X15-166B]|uniref:tol-pal system protein YbgF n=1 Tax=Marinobacter sp. X15-166B TaxID=1897620 RepID=UPI00085BE8F7|nr:tol-pal system protein YbgF [Marinobacter sp. X15-166B]OEY67252.1 tol-pal system protein YbgF [Marinobacter sp. X15-166B]
MRKYLMATVALSFVGSALAQSATPAFQTSQAAAQRTSAATQGNAELFYMIEQLQREVRQLRGTLEEQSNQIDRLSRQSKSRYIDLDQRILSLSEQLQNVTAVPVAAEQPAQAQSEPRPSRDYRAPGDEEQQAYQAIQALIHDDKDYDAAISALYDFISKYPEGDLMVNAYYWLGEVYLVKPQLEQAKQAFTIVISRYDDHRKAPDAAYKLGITLDRQGSKQQAISRMEEVVSNYPQSSAAALAQKFLDAR